MLNRLLKLYVTALAGQVTSPVPHLFGPPGSGKSTVVAQLADTVGVRLHTINVSRISPLELEGIQMPIEDNSKLKLLHATFWTQLKEGDVLLLDEFLRGFPEVYNGLLDIITSREVAGFQLPNVFIIAASNSTVAYDKALEDRLLHLPVADPRKCPREKDRLAKLFVEVLGLHPKMVEHYDTHRMLEDEVLPTYEVMDNLGNRKTAMTASASVEGVSLRNLIGQVQLRELRSTALKTVIDMNNEIALREKKPQFVVLPSGSTNQASQYEAMSELAVEAKDRLTPVQLHNLDINLQLLALAEAQRAEKEKYITYIHEGRGEPYEFLA